MPNLKIIKQHMREQVIAARAQARQQIPDAALRVRDHFLNFFTNLDTRLIVSGTSPINGEVNPMPLMLALEEKGHPICLPITMERAAPLVFRAYKTGDRLVANVWDIGVPEETQPIVVPDILLVPLLAFDRHGGRLGYGGGYYDATLQTLRANKSVLAVALAYSAQELAQVPLGKFDQRMDAIITENEVINVS
jgi:5-formyltetrahydrofolate cyclo-ligase